MRDVPESLLTGPFTREHAMSLGVSKSMLAGARFVRVHPGVWRHRDHRMTWSDDVRAARLALPPSAVLTHLTRIQALGLDFGAGRPLHFVIEGELHLAVCGIFLHRTKQLAPSAAGAVVPAAAFVAYCSTATLLDAIVVGDWLVRHGHMTVLELVELAVAAPWRDGADEALFVHVQLDGGSRSLKESALRAILEASGLPRAEPSHPLALGDDARALGDLVYVEHGLVVEFQGGHHQEDRQQYVADIERFALFRDHGIPYVEVTRESLARPRTLVGIVYRKLVALGYDGPPPQFGDRWRALHRPVRDLLPSRRTRLRELAADQR